MNQSNRTTNAAHDGQAELLRQTERQGVRPLSFDELLGDKDAGDPDKEDVDDFLALRRDRRASSNSRERTDAETTER